MCHNFAVKSCLAFIFIIIIVAIIIAVLLNINHKTEGKISAFDFLRNYSSDVETQIEKCTVIISIVL